VIHDHAFAFQHHTDPPITKPAAFVCDSPHLSTYFWIVRRTITPDGFRINTNKAAGPALRDIMIPYCAKRCLSPLV